MAGGSAGRAFGNLFNNSFIVSDMGRNAGDPTLAVTILALLVHNAYKINLKGESMRKRQAS